MSVSATSREDSVRTSAERSRGLSEMDGSTRSVDADERWRGYGGSGGSAPTGRCPRCARRDGKGHRFWCSGGGSGDGSGASSSSPNAASTQARPAPSASALAMARRGAPELGGYTRRNIAAEYDPRSIPPTSELDARPDEMLGPMNELDGKERLEMAATQQDTDRSRGNMAAGKAELDTGVVVERGSPRVCHELKGEY